MLHGCMIDIEAGAPHRHLLLHADRRSCAVQPGTRPAAHTRTPARSVGMSSWQPRRDRSVMSRQLGCGARRPPWRRWCAPPKGASPHARAAGTCRVTACILGSNDHPARGQRARPPVPARPSRRGRVRPPAYRRLLPAGSRSALAPPDSGKGADRRARRCAHADWTLAYLQWYPAAACCSGAIDEQEACQMPPPAASVRANCRYQVGASPPLAAVRTCALHAGELALVRYR